MTCVPFHKCSNSVLSDKEDLLSIFGFGFFFLASVNVGQKGQSSKC